MEGILHHLEYQTSVIIGVYSMGYMKWCEVLSIHRRKMKAVLLRKNSMRKVLYGRRIRGDSYKFK